MRAALWARVSTSDQDADNQLLELRAWAARRNITVVKEYRLDGVSAFKGDHRDDLNRALTDARAGRYDVLLVWAMDRFTREGGEMMLFWMRKFSEAGAPVWSMTELWTETADPMVREMLGGLYGTLARAESARRSERQKASVQRRKAQGVPVGRKPGSTDKKPRSDATRAKMRAAAIAREAARRDDRMRQEVAAEIDKLTTARQLPGTKEEAAEIERRIAALAEIARSLEEGAA